ncbi:MAG: putative hydroxymethylpyrimidine transport system permease protein [Yoonia sp.]|jgi:putative hydroxymethylpyrimidine transport system permease protein|uniref:ABC transporter permease protein n=1 Tax=Octadecabacter arcticus 238 TaxID=391616 RepID=M9RH92_9RHOB|nr:ABC transporter permease [Octadecabacter arcticus]AGI71944.1 ABC transporter permease protein [Octadecabacter arcticus 238]
MTGWRAGIAATCLVLVLWQTVIWTTGVARFILPPPVSVAQTIWESRALLAEHAVITMAEVLIGLVLGAAFGFMSAIGLVASPTVRALVRPILVFSQAVPVFALAPILTLWLGFGLWSKITMTIIIIYFPVTSSFFDALMRTNRDWIGLAKVMGASPARIMWYIRVPAAMPGFASGLRLAAVYAPIGAIIGEWVGASKGLGYLMLLANGRAKTDLMFAALIVLAVLTILLHSAVNRLCEKTMDRPEVS